MINNRKLSDLKPDVQQMCIDFINRCAANGVDVIITSTYRDNESQAALYAQGRTSPGKKVTNAKPGQSYHNYRVAFDFVPVVNGKAIWNDRALFERCGVIAESCGLEWAGRWTRFRELCHCQLPGLTIAQLKQKSLV